LNVNAAPCAAAGICQPTISTAVAVVVGARGKAIDADSAEKKKRAEVKV
jgi:hypothetical protein